MSEIAIPDPSPDPLLPAPNRDGRRYLAGLRRAVWQSCKAPDGPVALARHAVLFGACAATPALARLLRARIPHVSVIEPDEDTAARLRDHLDRAGIAVSVVAEADARARAGLVIVHEGSADETAARLGQAGRMAGDGAPVLLLTEGGTVPERAARVVRLRLVVPGSGLAEFLLSPEPEAQGPGPEQIRQAMRLSARLGCLPLAVPAGAAGAGPRLLARLEATAEALCFAGTPPWELDEAAEALGFAIGPCALMDRLGLDSTLRRRAALVADGVDLPDPGALARMVAEGRLGRSASVGWYRYPGGGGRVVDPLIEDLLREEAWFASHSPRSFDPATLQRHLLAALIDESARLLEAGAVARPSDIDLVAALALGFPPGLGGPVWLADRQGTGAALAAVDALADDLAGLPGLPPPAPSLIAAARGGAPLSAVPTKV